MKCSGAITDLFERVTLLNKVVARRKFYTATMIEGEKMMTYIKSRKDSRFNTQDNGC